MNRKHLDRTNLGKSEDWHGNNIALSCPVCGKVYIVSGLVDRKGRICPNCGRSKAFVDTHGETAWIESD